MRALLTSIAVMLCYWCSGQGFTPQGQANQGVLQRGPWLFSQGFANRPTDTGAVPSWQRVHGFTVLLPGSLTPFAWDSVGRVWIRQGGGSTANPTLQQVLNGGSTAQSTTPVAIGSQRIELTAPAESGREGIRITADSVRVLGRLSARQIKSDTVRLSNVYNRYHEEDEQLPAYVASMLLAPDSIYAQDGVAPATYRLSREPGTLITSQDARGRLATVSNPYALVEYGDEYYSCVSTSGAWSGVLFLKTFDPIDNITVFPGKGGTRWGAEFTGPVRAEWAGILSSFPSGGTFEGDTRIKNFLQTVATSTAARYKSRWVDFTSTFGPAVDNTQTGAQYCINVSDRITVPAGILRFTMHNTFFYDNFYLGGFIFAGPTRIEGFAFESPNAGYNRGVSFENFGLRTASAVQIYDAKVCGTTGAGFEIQGYTDAGNANGFIMNNCLASFNAIGLLIGGRDANAGSVTDCRFYDNHIYGVKDYGFLGNQISHCIFELNGFSILNRSVVTHQGNVYRALVDSVAGIEPGVAAGWQSYWALVGPGEPSARQRAYVSGTQYRLGADVVNNDNNARTTLVGCYVEDSPLPLQLQGKSLVVGGFAADKAGQGLRVDINTLRYNHPNGASFTRVSLDDIGDVSTAISARLKRSDTTQYVRPAELESVRKWVQTGNDIQNLNSGNVAIGAPSNVYKLRVVSTMSAGMQITGVGSNPSEPLINLISGPVDGILTPDANGGKVVFGSFSNHPVAFRVANVERAAVMGTGDISLPTAGAGVIVTTPDGTKKYRISVDNAGLLQSTLIP